MAKKEPITISCWTPDKVHITLVIDDKFTVFVNGKQIIQMKV